MSLDLSAAVETAVGIIARRWNMSSRNRDVRADAAEIVTAAAPLIEQAVREQVAREIEEHPSVWRGIVSVGVAAKVARGGAS